MLFSLVRQFFSDSLRSLFFKIFIIGFLIDQVSKFVARNLLFLKSYDFGFLRFDLVFNTGAAYGVFSDYTYILLVIGIVVIGYVFSRLDTFLETKIDSVIYGCLIAGAMGNTLDRLLFGKVTDFINIQIIPVFNIADTLINIGIGLLLFQWFYYGNKKQS